MLARAYLDRIGAEAILAAGLPPGLARPRYDDLGLLTATSLAFALGMSSAEGAEHLIPARAGILAGVGRLPGPRTPGPRLAAIAGACGPLALQRQLAAAMLAVGAPGLHAYYAGDHFVPCEGARPVAGTPSAATPSPAAPAPWSPATRAGRCASPPAGRPGFPPPCRPSWPSRARCSARRRRSCPAWTGAAPTRSPSAPSASSAPTGSPGGAARSPRSPPRRAGTGPPPATAGPPKSSPSPMRARRSRTTARPGRSPCPRTASRCCRCSPATPPPRRWRCWPGCAAGGGSGTCSSTRSPATASTGCATTTPAPKTTTT